MRLLPRLVHVPSSRYRNANVLHDSENQSRPNQRDRDHTVDRLVAFAKDEKLEALRASVLADNPAMQKLLEGAGFQFHDGSAPEILDGELRLNA